MPPIDRVVEDVSTPNWTGRTNEPGRELIMLDAAATPMRSLTGISVGHDPRYIL
jgi:hypothetical protein